MSPIQVFQEGLNMFRRMEQDECVIVVSVVEHRFEFNGAISQPNPFMMAQKRVGQGGAQGGAHRHSLDFV